MPPQETEQRIVAGRYRLRSVLGAGSMGTVWAAYDEFLHRPVAVKEVRLPPGFPASQVEELRERTLREARAIAALSHPNVITLHDVVREDDEPFVVMELLNARSLGGLLADHGPLTVEQAATVGEAVAAALEAAHAAGITHRDVKPGNVLVARDGHVKLTDFGIARNVSEVTMTRTGIMLGSPAYMAPEVASGKGVTPAADLWGLGATLFTVVEGHPPYDADGDPLATASAVVHDEVPAPSAGPFADIISRLMSKDPTDRPTPRAVRAQLFPLRAQPNQPLFPVALFDRDTETEQADGAAVPVRAASAPVIEQEVGAAPDGGTAPLAADPGPLPFAPAGPRSPVRPDATGAQPVRAGRGPVSAVLIALLAIVVFLLAGAAGFAAARLLGGADVLPVFGSEPVSAAAQSLARFEQRSGDASGLKGTKGGLFTVSVPGDWAKFSTQQPNGTLPDSTLVQFVSPDGGQVLDVERFAGFFESHDLDNYLTAVESDWYAEDFVLVGRERLAGPDSGVVITYRTVEKVANGSSPEEPASPSPGPSPRTLSRTTFAQVLRIDSSLWVISVTVPTEQEGRGRTQLFDRIAPTFTTTD
ncbi:MAG: protein kinase domain-containing protein [Haloechinothrix sp.]